MYKILKSEAEEHLDNLYVANESFKASTKLILNDIFTKLISMVKQDIDIDITNDDIFISPKYKELLNSVNKEILDKYNINLIIVGGDKTSVYVKDTESKNILINLAKSGIAGKKIDANKEIKNLKKSVHTIKGNKIDKTMTMYMVINFYKLIVDDKVNAEYLTDLVETSVYQTLTGVNMVTVLMDDCSKILKDIKRGSTIDDIYVNHFNGKRDDINDKSEFNKAGMLIEGMISKYGESNSDSEKKMSIFVRIFYLIALVNVMVIITVASTTPVLLYSVVTLIIYTIFLYIYRLAAKVITGKKDPLNEGFNGIVAPDEIKMVDKDIADTDANLSNIVKKESKNNHTKYFMMANAIKNDFVTNVSDYVTNLFGR